MQDTLKDWSLALAHRWGGQSVYVDSWAIEKLAKVVEALGHARDACADPVMEEALVEAWRNAAKLGAWTAHNTFAYDEEAVQGAFKEGGHAMRHHLEWLLGAS
jgi:hypothetical protein